MKGVFIKNFKALCSLCGCFRVSREQMAQAHVHREDTSIWSLSHFAVSAPHQSMDIFGSPGRLEGEEE